MTLLIADVASYQGTLTADHLKAAGIGAVNIKVSHGLTRKSVHPNAASWAARARALGLGLCTFHWLTADADGTAQADHAYRQMADLGLTDAAHQLDVEAEPAPGLASVRSYLIRMTSLTGRPCALYTGDWWWKPRGWDLADLAPYLWAAPNAGYLGTYPGDTSPAWQAGYGGWPELAVMQYAVQPVGGIKVSLSAIRDPRVWRHLTLGRRDVSYAPDTIMTARKFFMDTLRSVGLNPNPASFGVIGDDAHANSGSGYHIGKDALKATAYSVVESSRDRAGLTNAASAFDIGWFSFTRAGKTHNLRTFSAWLVQQCRNGTADTADIREVIYSTDGRTVHRWDRLKQRNTGDDSHLTHTHISWFRDSENRAKKPLFERYFTEIGILEAPDMPLTAEEIDQLTSLSATRTVSALLNYQVASGGTNLGSLLGVWVTNYNRAGAASNTQLPAIAQAVGAVLKNVTDDDAVVAQVTGQLLAAIDEASDDTADAVLDRLGGAGQSDAEIASALRAALGDRAPAVGALLQG